MALADERYVLFTTLRRNGTPVPTPVWIVDLGGGEAGFTTSSTTGKAKRLAHSSRVFLQPCDMRGKVRAGSEPIEASARLVTGDRLADIRARIAAKYPLGVRMMGVASAVAGVLGRPRPDSDRGVVITLPRST